MMENAQQEDQEAPFEYVKSKRKPKTLHRRLPPAATSGSSSSSSSAIVKAGTSYSNSSGSIFGASSGGFTYSMASRSGKGKKGNKSKNRNGIAVVLSEEEEAQRALSRACGMVDVFVGYLSSELQLVPDGDRDGEGKVEDGGARGRSYAGKMRDCFEAVWPSSFHQQAALHSTAKQTKHKQDQQDVEEEADKKQKAMKKGCKAKEKSKPAIPSKIVCLGLGSPLTSKSAQVQLALLIVLRRWLWLLLGATTHSTTSQEENEEGQEEKGEVSESIATSSEVRGKEWRGGRWEEVEQGRDGVECVAYDPVFTALDEVLLSRYGVDVARPTTDKCANAEASKSSTPAPTAASTSDSNPTSHRSIESHYTAIKTPTLLYMPHCDRELYENILSLNYPPSPSPPPPSSSSTPSPPLPPSQSTTPIVLLCNILTNYATFTSNLDTSSPTLSRLLHQFTVEMVPNWENGKRSALVHEAKEEHQSRLTAETIGEFVKGWDRNALRDLAFHWIVK